MAKSKDRLTIAPARHVEAWRIRVALTHGLNVRCIAPNILAGVDSLRVSDARIKEPKGLTEVKVSNVWQVPLRVWTVEQPKSSSVERTAPAHEAHSCRPGSCRDVSAATGAPDVAASFSPSLAPLAVPSAVLMCLVALLAFCSLAVAQISRDKPTTKRASEMGLSVQGNEVSDGRVSQVLSAGATTQLPRPVASEPALAPTLRRKAFFSPYGRGFVLSSVIYWSGAFADIASSRGKFEGNPLLRSRNGSIHVGRALALQAVPYGLSLLLERRHPKVAGWLRFIDGAVHLGVAAHNWRV